MNLEPLEPKTDDRGLLAEAFHLPNDGQVFYVIMPPKVTRGNHYHNRKEETFVVIYGTAEMEIKDRDTGRVVKVKLAGTDPMRVKVVPNHVHNITSGEDGCMFITWVNEIFDKKDPDTFQEEV